MMVQWLKRTRFLSLGACAALLVAAGASRAVDNDVELRALIEQQNKQIQALKEKLDALATAPVARTNTAEPAAAVDPDAVKKIVGDYLKENPGAGMPPGVQTGYSTTTGFVIRSAPDPQYVKWDDDCKIPFELRVRGRIQLDYYNYKTTDLVNHQSNRSPVPGAGGNTVRLADFSQLEIKRTRLQFFGTVFDPNLRYWIELDGNTRGLGGVQNNKVIQTADTVNPGNNPAAIQTGGGVTVDHAVRLFSAYVAYDFHGAASEKGCGPDCPEGTFKYAPTYTFIVGKYKPFFAFEEYMGSGNQQFVEYAMTEWFFDADDDNLMMQAGTQIRAMDDRFFLQASITNGNESQFPNTQMDNLPGFNVGLWYDFGGTFNRERGRWDLYGDSIADVDYSCKPVVRVGAAANIVPMNRRSLYGDDEQSRVFVMPGGPGGTRLINMLAGGNTTNGSHAVDEFDEYTYEAFITAHYKGFSILSDWFVHDLNNFRTTPNGRGDILYTDGLGRNAIFPVKSMIDYGSSLQVGYFIIPKKFEIAARWSWVRGESGDINGSGHVTTTTIPGVAGTVD
ncbi:MAG TPA: hypothetical protein VGY58_20740, partial [Gemmataceae bacterium]|nr:hypothetical protein [Gemmataceae bacterium]